MSVDKTKTGSRRKPGSSFFRYDGHLKHYRHHLHVMTSAWADRMRSEFPTRSRRKVERGFQTACGLPAQRHWLASQCAPCKGGSSVFRRAATDSDSGNEKYNATQCASGTNHHIGKLSGLPCSTSERAVPADCAVGNAASTSAAGAVVTSSTGASSLAGNGKC